jgi:hypothetical protein
MGLYTCRLYLDTDTDFLTVSCPFIPLVTADFILTILVDLNSS